MSESALPMPTDFGDREYQVAMVNVTNVCNLKCSHCFIFREGNPNSPRDKMDDATMLHQLRVLRDRHRIKYMYFMGGEPMIRRDLVFEGMKLFEHCQIVTNGTYGIPSVPGHVVTVSLDGPEEMNDRIRGDGVFGKVREAVFARQRDDGTDVILQMVVTRQNQDGLEDFFAEARDWPIEGVAVSPYVPRRDDRSGLDWPSLAERDQVIHRLIALKEKYPDLMKANAGALRLMLSETAMDFTGSDGENCPIKGNTLTLYVGDDGTFQQTYCCYGNDVDCARCGSYLLFNSAYHRLTKGGGVASRAAARMA
ncbi:MAG: radical SAM protein [Alphaproteobacteria bacterium]|jgi:MoaA/NifB/PqqE/SkfB family radical SAM enzyme|nr:radical SAM protein [Alphaproteobacteria bacterium]MDP6564509.1 radical SAM protein [Alphaproteobacteria bacterium]MDP6814188.1 radical SAM protein [Alphaproteobacteria bacterium]